LLLAGTLATGMLVGVALGRTWLAPDFPRLPPFAGRPGSDMAGGRNPLGNPQEIHGIIARRLGRELKLSPAQQESLNRVMAEQAEVLGSIQQEVQPRMEAFLESTRSRVDSLLTAEQRERFRRLTPTPR
jgi:hypothetical protein